MECTLWEMCSENWPKVETTLSVSITSRIPQWPPLSLYQYAGKGLREIALYTGGNSVWQAGGALLGASSNLFIHLYRLPPRGAGAGGPGGGRLSPPARPSSGRMVHCSPSGEKNDFYFLYLITKSSSCGMKGMRR